MITRRDLLRSTGTGLGLLGLYGLLGDTGALANDTTPPDPRNPLGPRPPHFPARVKHVIHVYLNGGPSQVDTFDPKPDAAGRQPYHRAAHGRCPALAVPIPPLRPIGPRNQRAI